MQRVTLETKQGAFIAHRLIPQLITPPDVLIWKEHVFALRARLRERWIYREVNVVTIVDKEEKTK